MDPVEKYLEITGQSLRDLYEGSSTYGPNFIEDELVPQALQENKRIVWIPDLVDGEDVGRVHYELQDL